MDMKCSFSYVKRKAYLLYIWFCIKVIFLKSLSNCFALVYFLCYSVRQTLNALWMDGKFLSYFTAHSVVRWLQLCSTAPGTSPTNITPAVFTCRKNSAGGSAQLHSNYIILSATQATVHCLCVNWQEPRNHTWLRQVLRKLCRHAFVYSAVLDLKLDGSQ